MTTDGSLDIGCGILSFHIEKPPKEQNITPLTLGEQKCNAPTSGHGDTLASSQSHWARWVCNHQLATSWDLGPGKSTSWDTTWESHMWFKISWIDGCVTTRDSQSQRQPLPDANCQLLMTENYSQCKESFNELRYKCWHVLTRNQIQATMAVSVAQGMRDVYDMSFGQLKLHGRSLQRHAKPLGIIPVVNIFHLSYSDLDARFARLIRMISTDPVSIQSGLDVRRASQ